MMVQQNLLGVNVPFLYNSNPVAKNLMETAASKFGGIDDNYALVELEGEELGTE